MNPRDHQGAAYIENTPFRTAGERISALVMAWRTDRLVERLHRRAT